MSRLSPITGAAKHDAPRLRGTGAPNAATSFPGTHPLLANTGLTGAAARPENRSTPSWLDAEACALLASIVAAAPDRTRPLTQTCCGIASYGFAGKEANRLREIYGKHYSMMLDFVGAVPFGSPAYLARRDALIAYDKLWNADALIERMLDARPMGDGSWRVEI